MPTAAESTQVVAAIVEQAPGRAGGRASPSSPTLVLAGVFAVLYAITAWKDDSLLTDGRRALDPAARLPARRSSPPARRCAC